MSTLEGVTGRVERLEAENRRLKQLGIAFLLCVAVSVLAGMNLLRLPKQLEAEQFAVRDATGRTRALLNLRNGQPALALFDESGREQLLLHSAPDRSASLDFFQRGHLRMSLETSTTGASRLVMLDAGQQSASVLYHSAEGASGLALNRGRGGALLEVQSDGAAGLGFLDVAGRARLGWSINPDGRLLPLETLTRSYGRDAQAIGPTPAILAIPANAASSIPPGPSRGPTYGTRAVLAP